MSENFDITPFIQSKSDQLNADDLLGGEITVRVVRVCKGGQDQPVVIELSGGHCPWKPCKTSLRVLGAAWGKKTGPWVGRSATLYRDETVKWAGKAVGGIRIRALSHIEQPMSISLTETRGTKKQHRIEVLRPGAESGNPTANLSAVLRELDLAIQDVDKWRQKHGRAPLEGASKEVRTKFAAWLAGRPDKVDEIRTFSSSAGGGLSAEQLSSLRAGAEGNDVEWSQVEAAYGCPIEELTVADQGDWVNGHDIYMDVVGTIEAITSEGDMP
ncbi:MAG: hypothetical protein AAGM22_21480 [Acidobacteriota bacterium]